VKITQSILIIVHPATILLSPYMKPEVDINFYEILFKDVLIILMTH